MLGLDIDLSEFYRFADHDPGLQGLVRDFRGAKPPRYPSLFEALVNAIAGQQISLTVAIHLLNRLTQAYRRGLPGRDGAGPRLPPAPGSGGA